MVVETDCFSSDLNKLGLEKKPYILVTTYNSSKITLESARRLGADFIIGKYEDSYSPESAVDFLEQLLPMIEMTESTSNTSYMKDNQKRFRAGTYPQNPPGTGAHWYQSKGCWLQISDRCHYDNN